MAGDLKMEILFRDAVYVLTGTHCMRFLACLEADRELGEVLGVLRKDLIKALSDKVAAPDNPFADESEEPPAPWLAPKGVIKNVAKENAEECGDCRIPKCRFCDKPGKRKGGRKDLSGKTVEHYYVCTTDDCLAQRTGIPQPLSLFAGGN